MRSDRFFQPFLAIAPDWWNPKKGELFDVYQNYCKIASCSFCIIDKQVSPRNRRQYFPDSWFSCRNISRTEPVLEIVDLETLPNRGKEYGRTVLQALYQKSILFGCGGRMQVLASFGSGTFYEQCGFKGGQNGLDGLKFFDPTDKSISILFAKGEELPRTKFIPIKLQRKNIDNNSLLKVQKFIQR